jgi:hypothetical protein
VSIFLTNSGANLVLSSGGIPTAGRFVSWEHDGLNVDGFILVVDAVEYDLGLLSPVSGTTYSAELPKTIDSGAHDIVVIAYHGTVRSDSVEVTLSW